MKLVVVESPNKVKKIGSFLGSGYKVGASFGHIRDLPASGDLGVRFENGRINPNYIVTKKDMAAQLKRLAHGAEEILIATDPDREGEAIGWHVMQLLGANAFTYKRVTFNQITKKAVLDAVANPTTIDMNLVNAQQARRVFDRVVGWVVSPTLRRGVGKKDARSAGRVQSTALRLVVERELAIRAFDNKDYFEIDAHLNGKNPPTCVATLFEWQGKKLEHRLTNANEAQALADSCKPGPWLVDQIDRKKANSFAPPPFTTSTAQQAASVKLKYAPDQTMKALQALFEAGHITYHRTDSVSLAPDAIKEARQLIQKMYGAAYVPEQENQHKSKIANAQEAHEAIRPTQPDSGPDSSAVTDFRDIYRLIWERYLASQMAAGVDDVTVYTIVTQSAPELKFRARGSVCIFDGWRVIGDDSTSEKKKKDRDAAPLPVLEVGEMLTLLKLKLNKKTTKPPPRFTQAALINEMEKRGIGRPSTYANIMKTIMVRTYVDEIKRKLHATDLGITVCEWLIEHYQGNFIEIAYTSGMEERLDAMSRGELNWETAITEESELLVQISQKAGLNYNPLRGEKSLPSLPVEGMHCPTCKGPMRAIKSSQGEFFGCMDYPKCTGTLPGKEQAEAEKNAPNCPLCDSSMRYRKSKHGAFWGCTAYPSCKGLRNADGEDKSTPNASQSSESSKAGSAKASTTKKAGKKTTKKSTAASSDVPSPACPQCQKPMRLVPEKPNVYKAFWSCSSYPSCKGTRPQAEESNPPTIVETKTPSTRISPAKTSKAAASKAASAKQPAFISPQCPECNSEMFKVPAQNGRKEHFSCRHAPDCDGTVEI